MVRSGLFNKFINRSAFSTVVSASVVSLAMLSGCTTMQTGKPAGSYGVAVTDRTVAQRILDKSIENTAKTNINAMDPTLHKRSRISVDSFYSTVLLTGEVPDEQTKKNVVSIVSSMPDVKQLYDKLNVGPQKGTSYTVHDGYISSKINTKILANDAISSSQVKVVTDDGVVYVLGKLTPTQRGHLVNIIESTVGIKELVLLTDLIDDNGVKIDESMVSQETNLEPPDNHYTVAPDTNAYPVQQGTVQSGSYSNTSNQLPVSQAPVNQTSINQTPVTQAPSQGPSQRTRPQGEPYASPYVEMYKDQVPGW